MNDPALSKISQLCTQIQTMCRKHTNLRSIAVDSLEETLERFELVIAASKSTGGRVTKTNKQEGANKIPTTSQKETQSVQPTLQSRRNPVPQPVHYIRVMKNISCKFVHVNRSRLYSSLKIL